MKHINLTPTWTAAIAMWFFAMENATPDKRAEVMASAKAEMMRLAEAYEGLQAQARSRLAKEKREIRAAKKAGGAR